MECCAYQPEQDDMAGLGKLREKTGPTSYDVTIKIHKRLNQNSFASSDPHPGTYPVILGFGQVLLARKREEDNSDETQRPCLHFSRVVLSSSSGECWDLELAVLSGISSDSLPGIRSCLRDGVEVRWRMLWSGDCSARKDYGRKEGGRWRPESDIKSHNPHLTGGVANYSPISQKMDFLKPYVNLASKGGKKVIHHRN